MPEQIEASMTLQGRIDSLERENGQLRQALLTRIVIEQAKGVLSERFSLRPDQAFELLRRAARSNRVRIHVLAAEVVANDQAPAGNERSASTQLRPNMPRNGSVRREGE